MPAKDDIPSELTALAGQHLEAHEVIVYWERRRKEARAVIMTKEMAALSEESRRRFGRGGCGRLLDFLYRGDQWELVNQGDWIS